MVFWKGWSWEVQAGAMRHILEALIRKPASVPWPQDL